jgi:hypothetical protein
MAILPVALVERGDALDDRKPRARGPFGVVVVRLWPPEIGKHAVAEVLRYIASEARDCFGHTAQIVSLDFAPFLGIEPRRDLGRAHQIAEQNCQMTALANVSLLDGRCLRDWNAIERAKRSSAFTAELRGRRIIGAALQTATRKCGSAFRAELPPRRAFGPAQSLARRSRLSPFQGSIAKARVRVTFSAPGDVRMSSWQYLWKRLFLLRVWSPRIRRSRCGSFCLAGRASKGFSTLWGDAAAEALSPCGVIIRTPTGSSADDYQKY